MRTSTKRFVGLVIILFGLMIFINSLHIHTAIVRFILPIVFIGIGLHFYRRNRRIMAAVFIGIAMILLLNINIFSLLLALFLIYFGFRMLQKNQHETVDGNEEPLEKKGEKRTLIGEYHLLNHRFELEDLTISHGIGDVKIDLTKAIIPEGETVIVINSWIGDIDIYVPYDLDLFVDATVLFGDVDVLGNRQSGFNRSLMKKTEHYVYATRKVKLVLSLSIGDIDVRYL